MYENLIEQLKFYARQKQETAHNPLGALVKGSLSREADTLLLAAQAIEALIAGQETLQKHSAELIAATTDKAAWISIKDKLPESEGQYLTCDEYGNIHVFYHTQSFEIPFAIHDNDPRFYPPTHWMPLPEPPKVGDNNG